MKRWGVRIAAGLGVVIALAIGGFVIWGLTPLGPGATARSVIEGSGEVTVRETTAGFEFSTGSVEPTVALVLYPGGRVDARSYAPLAALIAERGYLVIVPPMPLSLAVLDPNAADEAIELHSNVESWSVGGHSLGGAMAAQYAAENADRLDGLVLLAAYASGSADLSDTGLGVLDIYGDRDGVLTMENHEAGASLLPKGTVSEVIEGGNHAQFGDYGEQPGDNPATITAQEQWAQTAQAVDSLLRGATTN